jgi:hypothetical protein
MILTTDRSVRFTAEQYDAAIQALQDGKTQLAPDGDPCHICHGGGHQAWECGFNPLYAMSLCETLADQSDDLHTTLHYLAGFDRRMGEREGPAKVVCPEPAPAEEVAA